ncbi:CCC motif membrane protein [Polaribacter sp.]|uniref:CCC motif membrane protein n=1 Tax=Polaribacter sp. TaxID=1920175 RepID=UPI0040477E52
MKRLNTTLIYVLSSISILCCCFGGLGILLALPSYLIANSRLKNAQLDSENYSSESLSAMNSAKTFALVTLIINGLYFAYSLYSIATTDWSTFMEEFQKGMEKYQSS